MFSPALLLVLVPPVVGRLISGSFPLMYVWSRIYLLSSLLFLAFWFWVGTRFAGLDTGKWTSLALGNGLTVFFLVVCLIFTAGCTAYVPGPLWLWAQMYPLLAVPLSSRILSLFFKTITSTSVLVMAYGLMLTTFFAGFTMRRRHRLRRG
ncbi:MAG: hypothetical protein AB1445_15505 [Bacillota bacterium]